MTERPGNLQEGRLVVTPDIAMVLHWQRRSFLASRRCSNGFFLELSSRDSSHQLGNMQVQVSSTGRAVLLERILYAIYDSSYIHIELPKFLSIYHIV